MTASNQLREALLGLGLEDLIPLPEAIDDPDVHAALGAAPATDQVAAALVELLHLGRISVWIGNWRSDPRRAGVREAEQLLRDDRRYAFANESSGFERVYFANVDNVP